LRRGASPADGRSPSPPPPIVIERRTSITLLDAVIDQSGGPTCLPKPAIVLTGGKTEHELLCTQSLFLLASKLRDGGADLGPIRLVPLVLSMSKLNELLTDEAMAKKPPREVLIRCFELDHLQSSDMLKQAIEMRALVAILDVERETDLRGLHDNPALLEELLTLRLVVACAGASDSVQNALPAALVEHGERFKIAAIGLYLNEVEVADKNVKDLLKRMRSGSSSYYSMVNSLHLATAEVAREGSAAITELLMSQTCALTSLDLSRTKVDGVTLLQAVRGNTSLTALDVRLIPDIAKVYHPFGDALLQEGTMCQVGFLRCDVFEVLEGEKALSLKETPLEPGAARLLVGLLKNNKMLTDVDLTATDLEKPEATCLATVLQFSENLSALRLQHNPMIDDEAKTELRAAAEEFLPNLRLEL